MLRVSLSRFPPALRPKPVVRQPSKQRSTRALSTAQSVARSPRVDTALSTWYRLPTVIRVAAPFAAIAVGVCYFEYYNETRKDKRAAERRHKAALQAELRLPADHQFVKRARGILGRILKANKEFMASIIKQRNELFPNLAKLDDQFSLHASAVEQLA